MTGIDLGALAEADVLVTQAVRPGGRRALDSTDDIVL